MAAKDYTVGLPQRKQKSRFGEVVRVQGDDGLWRDEVREFEIVIDWPKIRRTLAARAHNNTAKRSILGAGVTCREVAP